MLKWLVIVLLAALLWLCFQRRLAKADYSPGWAAGLAAVAIAQPVYLHPALAAQCLLFAFFSYAVASEALAFAEQKDARRIVLLGGSLAGTQIISPVNGLLLAASMPLVLTFSGRVRGLSSSAGLVPLLLFLPALAAIAMLWAQSGYDVALLRPDSGGKLLKESAAIAPLLAPIPIIPVIWSGLRMSLLSARIVASIAYFLSAGALISECLGGGSYADAIVGATGPLAVLVIGSFPINEARTRSASVALLSGVALSWTIALVLRFI